MRKYARPSPTLNHFLGGQFLGPFLVCLAAFTSVYLLGDTFERFDDLIQYGGFGVLGLEYFALKIPLMVSQLLPVACLTGVLLGFALLNRSGELLACQQLGVSRLGMAVPILFAGVLISLFDFALSEVVVPQTARHARYLYEVELKNRKLRGVFDNQRIWVRMRYGFLAADRYDAGRRQLDGVTLYQVDRGYNLRSIVHAESALWDGLSWAAKHPVTITFQKDGTASAASAGRFAPEVSPGDFDLLHLEPEEFSFWELENYINGLRRKGLVSGGYNVDRDLKCALPVSCLIMTMLGIVLSLDPLPRTSSLGRNLGIAIAIGLGYWVTLGVTSSLGRSDVLAAWFAAWLPNATFATIASAIFLFGEER